MAKTLADYRQEAMDLVDELTNPASGKYSTAWWTRRINKAKDAVAERTGFYIQRHLVPVTAYTEWSAKPSALCWGILGIRLGRNPVTTDEDPFDFEMWNADFPNQPSNDGIEILSSETADTTQKLTIYGTTYATDAVVSEQVTLNGTTQVAAVKTDWAEILYAELDGPCAGTLTIREASGNATIATIAAGATQAGYMPSTGSPVSCRIQGQRLYWTPLPDSASTVIVVGGGIPVDLAGESDTITGLPKQYDSIIALGAACEAQGIDVYDTSQQTRNNDYARRFEMMLAGLIDHLNNIDRSRTGAFRLATR